MAKSNRKRPDEDQEKLEDLAEINRKNIEDARKRKSVKPGKAEITEEMIPFIEARLDLPAGTLIKEIAADLTNRFGDPSANRKELIAEFNITVEKYIVKTYGELVTDGIGYPMSYGTRVNVNKDSMHLRKKF